MTDKMEQEPTSQRYLRRGHPSIHELIREQGVKPVGDARELLGDLWIEAASPFAGTPVHQPHASGIPFRRIQLMLAVKRQPHEHAAPFIVILIRIALPPRRELLSPLGAFHAVEHGE